MYRPYQLIISSGAEILKEYKYWERIIMILFEIWKKKISFKLLTLGGGWEEGEDRKTIRYYAYYLGGKKIYAPKSHGTPFTYITHLRMYPQTWNKIKPRHILIERMYFKRFSYEYISWSSPCICLYFYEWMFNGYIFYTEFIFYN